ncbi:MAG TPA: peptidase S8, partial [Bacteroidia bacterium]|nr:peptidase S8 [Bacteroidia bacterium]
PTLTPEQMKKILMKSSIKDHKSEKVIKPGTKDVMVKFEKLSKTAGCINLYEAIKMADKYTKTKT